MDWSDKKAREVDRGVPSSIRGQGAVIWRLRGGVHVLVFIKLFLEVQYMTCCDYCHFRR